MRNSRMSSRRPPRRRTAIELAGALVLSCLLTLMSTGGALAGNLQQIDGSGSTWAGDAVNQWIKNVYSQGVDVVFDPTGSAAGRTAFAQGTTDFAVSDIGYQGIDPQTGSNDSSNRPYAYMPVTAGGTSFPYHLTVAGRQVTNLRLSGLTLAKIFTNQITNWNDSAITRDNNGRQLPALPITTVVPSEGSGTTAMFTQYLNYEFPALWKSFNHGLSGFTEYWPRQGNNQIAQNGSTQVMNYIESAAANGAIGVDEYAYPKQAGYPVAQIENSAGYFVLPSEYNDAVALTQAVINMDKSSPNYLLQSLNNVYGYGDPRTYPLSSYSYTVMPTSPADPRMKASGGAFPAKWQTLADFLYYSICQGQTYIGPIGYSALPINLVEAGFTQIDKIKSAAPQVNISQQNVSTCHNPTFIAGQPNRNYLAQIAPYPPSCDKAGQGPCIGVLDANANGGRGSTGANGGGTTPTSSGSGPTTGATSPNSARSTGGASPGAKGGKIDPATGQIVGAGPGSGSGSVTGVVSVLPASNSSHLDGVLGVLAVLLLLTALVAPPALVRLWSRGRRQP
jgi:phosphate transport system substrate-binding protein